MDDAIRLLQAYQTYQETGGNQDLAAFGTWLQQARGTSPQAQPPQEVSPTVSVDVHASYLLSSLVGFVETWVKLSFQELPILSLNDFGIILNVEQLEKPTKKMVAERMLMEHSSCIESIRRLIKEGLLAEEMDPADKRRRRISLTDSGQKMAHTLKKKMQALGTLLVGNLTASEKQALIPLLQKLVNFHQGLYQAQPKAQIKEAFGL